MAIVQVVADNFRVEDAETTTNWSNDGGGGGIATEPDIVYQGTFAASRKVGTSVIGRAYTHPAGVDMDGTPENRRHYIAKVAATNYAALLARTAPALHMKVGSSSSDYHTYYLFGNDNYPAKGGFQIIAIAPSVAGYTGDAADVGTPNNSSILYWSVLGDFSANSKAENLVIDAIDVGAGLNIYGGDGASTDATFQDLINYDEGTGNNRFGYVTTEGPVLLVNGRIAIGQTTGLTTTATDFTDSDRTVVWQNGLAASGFHNLRLDLNATGVQVNMTRCNFNSIGEQNNTASRGYITTEDTRTIFDATGELGSGIFTNCNFNNFSRLDLSTTCNFDTCVITNSGPINAGGGARLNNSSVLESAVGSGESAVIWNNSNDPDTYTNGMIYNKGASGHHAMEFGLSSPWVMTIRNWETSEFNASNNQPDSTLYFARTTGTITMNVVGGAGNFSYDTAGATINVVVDPVDTTITVLDSRDTTPISGARVLVEASNGSGDLPYQDSISISVTSGTATVTHTSHGMSNGDKVLIEGADSQDLNGVKTISGVTANSYTYSTTAGDGVDGGTTIATGVVIDGATDVNGKITDTRTWTNPQPIIGRARKSTSSPYYKTAAIAGTISTTAGLSSTVQLIIDE